jgi:hypothetical protein
MNLETEFGRAMTPRLRALGFELGVVREALEEIKREAKIIPLRKEAK